MLGRQLGADVPFFIYGQNAYASGIGDEFTPMHLPLEYFVLVKPDFHIPTKSIFSAVEKFSDTKLSPEEIYLAAENDLQTVAIKLFPKLKNIINSLSAFGTPSMTGSGSTVFLRFSQLKDANKVAQELGTSYNTYLVKTLNQSPVFTMSC